MKNYQKQTENILQKMGVKFSSEYITHDYHFEDDKETRDIYRCTFKRDGKRFSIRFGQSLKESNYGNANPTAYDVVSCLIKNDPDTFENFCAEFGYDTDSRKAEKIYRAVCEEWEKVSAFFTEKELSILQTIN